MIVGTIVRMSGSQACTLLALSYYMPFSDAFCCCCSKRHDTGPLLLLLLVVPIQLMSAIYAPESARLELHTFTVLPQTAAQLKAPTCVYHKTWLAGQHLNFDLPLQYRPAPSIQNSFVSLACKLSVN
jgi:hypothetical protein